MTATAALQQTAEGQHPTSFRDVLTSTPTLNNPLLPCHPIQKEQILHKGEPAVYFSKSDVTALSKPLQRALIGKISWGRPPLETLRKNFQTIGFTGGYHIGLLDNRHILIRFDNDDDYHRCWIRAVWSFGRYSMRMLKWTPEFTTDEEPAVAPVWISLQHLPLHLFGTDPLFYIANQIGGPLKIDAATQNLTRPSVARICVEINLLNNLPKRLWIGTDTSGFWQSIEYENLPNYCHACKKLGHNQLSCNPQKHMGETLPQPKQQVWRMKEPLTRMEKPMQPSVVHASTSGLSAEEKEAEPIDVSDLPTQVDAGMHDSAPSFDAVLQDNSESLKEANLCKYNDETKDGFNDDIAMNQKQSEVLEEKQVLSDSEIEERVLEPKIKQIENFHLFSKRMSALLPKTVPTEPLEKADWTEPKRRRGHRRRNYFEQPRMVKTRLQLARSLSHYT